MEPSWSREQLRSLLRQSRDIVILIDEAGRVSFVNEAVEDMLGYDREELIGANAFEVVHAEDRPTVLERFNDLIETPGSSTDRVQHRMVGQDGGIRWVESIGTNRTDTVLDGYVITTRDISAIKASEAALERQIERLDEFASVVSHDLRNPLTVAKQRVELAAAEHENDDLERAIAALDRMEALISDLLSLARAGEVVGETDRVEIADVLDSCWQNVETGSAALDVETDVAISADETRLRQLVENLLRNAIEHGGDDVTITVGTLPNGFFIEDDGPGIPPDERDRVFEPGYSTSASGTGFGLSIVRDIARAHDWHIEVSTSDAGGARFEITAVQPD